MSSSPPSTPTEVREVNVLQNLHSKRHLDLLNVIDSLRAQGLNEHVALPQLIVCGDQSSGKSSVLEAISGVPFPKKQNLCTRFATEVILRRDDKLERSQIDVSIMPDGSRSAAEKTALKAFQRHMDTITELPQVMDEASKAMGLGNMAGDGAFSTDILRLEVRGPQMPQLTIVDLPGLIHSETKFQSAKDVKLVTSLVERYMKQERTIILAIVSAKNDYANQIVLTKAKAVDPKGKRTLGIITKPDTVTSGSAMEESFISLAENQDVKFTLGWHVVKNLDSDDFSDLVRDAQEKEFFKTSNWNALNPNNRGIAMLRDRLSEVLFEQIKTELPSLLAEIASAMNLAKMDLTRMGRSRNTEADRRLFVVELGQSFQDLCRAACEGTYEHPFFREKQGEDKRQRRLRAIVQNRNMEFSKDMLGSSHEVYSDEHILARAQVLIGSHRGKELPGTFNPLLIGQLFKELSSEWLGRSQRYVQDIWCFGRDAILDILDSITEEHVRDACMTFLIDPQLTAIREKLDTRLVDYMESFQRQPITYNHYLTEKAQAMERSRQSKNIESVLDKWFADDRDIEKWHKAIILDDIRKSTQPDMDKVAAQQLSDYAQAYFTVATKRVIDEVPAHVVEPSIMTQLPKLLNSSHVFGMPSELVDKIAGESPERIEKRKQLDAKVTILEKSKLVCEVYAAKGGDVVTPDSSVHGDEIDGSQEEITDDDEEDDEEDDE